MLSEEIYEVQLVRGTATSASDTEVYIPDSVKKIYSHIILQRNLHFIFHFVYDKSKFSEVCDTALAICN